MREDAKKLEETRWLFEEAAGRSFECRGLRRPLRRCLKSASSSGSRTTGTAKQKSPQRRLRAPGIIAGLAFVVYCCVASLVNQEEAYAAPSKPYAPKADTREKRQADGLSRPFREGASWGGQWRASSEPGGIYMEGGSR